MKVEMGKKYRTKSGLDVELIGTDFGDGPCVRGIVFYRGEKTIWSWFINGSYWTHMASDRDLVEVTEPTIPEGWTAWHGGECPVHDRAQVEIICRDGIRMQPLSASSWTWKHNDNSGDIIAYRVVEPTYRPFANAKEFQPHRDRWIKCGDSESSDRWKVNDYNDKGFWVNRGNGEWMLIDSAKALEVWQFDDGTPFGVRVE